MQNRKQLFFIIITLFLAAPSYTYAQQSFDRKVTNVGNMGLSISNVGTIGKPDVLDDPSGDPSFEFPLNSGQEHLFEAGIWVGALVNGTLRLSTSAVTNPSGYSTGRAGYEFTNGGNDIALRSSLPESPFFSPLAVSHQDLVANFSDRRIAIETETGSITISGHENPLLVDVDLESYNWNFSFTEEFTILKYTFINSSEQVWDSVYIGMYADLINRNVNSSLDQGGAFFNKNGIGYMDSLYTSYVFDAGSSDNPSINTYGGMGIIGADYRDLMYHESNEEYLRSIGERVPEVGPSYWLFSAGSGDFLGPNDDQLRYDRMVNDFPYDQYEDRLRTDGQNSEGNYISFMKIGPFPEVLPGERFSVYFTYVAGSKPGNFQRLVDKPVDNETTRAPFVENISWVFRTFQGEDDNNNGMLDDGEDLNDNGTLDRFLIPEPPQSPRTKVVLESNSATLYWDRRAEESIDPISGEQDFEGYRVYKSQLGADLDGNIGGSVQPIAEFDSTGNNIGFNTGFDAIELSQPETFSGDDTEYWYKYEIADLMSGWQYQFSITAFDGGSSDTDIESLESSPNANAVRVFPGTPANTDFKSNNDEFKVGVYPNPYRVNAAWDGSNTLQRKIVFYNLPELAEVKVYTLAGELVAQLQHDANTYNGDIRWFEDFSADNRIMSGGEHAWDLLSEANQNLSTGLYLYTVEDKDTGATQRGKLVIIK
jgi:hypothetical protein